MLKHWLQAEINLEKSSELMCLKDDNIDFTLFCFLTNYMHIYLNENSLRTLN